MSVHDLLVWIENLGFATAIRESSWLFPTIETVHVFAIVQVVGSILTVDLRLIGWTDRDRQFSQLASAILPWTWSCFAVAATSGLLLFSSRAVDYFANLPFLVKMFCLLLAALNMLVFHGIVSRNLSAWDRSRPPPAARFAGAASLVLWSVIVGAGRWIGFTT